MYIDDIMIFTANLAEHRKIVTEVLQILQDNKLYLKHTKCKFEQLETKYLRLIVDHQMVKIEYYKLADHHYPKTTTRILRISQLSLIFHLEFCPSSATTKCTHIRKESFHME